jgi:hypothetical protein
VPVKMKSKVVIGAIEAVLTTADLSSHAGG